MDDFYARKKGNTAIIIGAILLVVACCLLLIIPRLQNNSTLENTTPSETNAPIATTVPTETTPTTEATIATEPPIERVAFNVHTGAFHGSAELLQTTENYENITVVQSLDALKELIDGPIYATQLKYNSAFFQENTLIVYDYVIPYSGTQVQVQNISYQYDLAIDLAVYYAPDPSDQRCSYGSLLIEVAKTYDSTQPSCTQTAYYPTKEEYNAQFGEPYLLEEFDQLFNDPTNWYARCLTEIFNDPRELRPNNLFMQGYSDGNGEITEAEWRELETEHGIDSSDPIVRIPKDTFDSVLADYFSTTLSDYFDKYGYYADLYYLESTDCYYIWNSGRESAVGFRATQVDFQEDGSVMVCYTIFGDESIYKLHLVPSGKGYQIQSNTYHTISPDKALDLVLRSAGGSAGVQSLECSYDDTDPDDRRYNISYVKNGYKTKISMNVSTLEYARHQSTPANPETLIVPDANDLEILQNTENSIPTIANIDHNRSHSGFIWDADGSSAISIHNGVPEVLTVQQATGTLVHNGTEHVFAFSWCTNAGQIGIYRLGFPTSPDVYLYPITGSDRYIMLDVSGDYQTRYFYLLDLATMEILDPLSSLDEALKDHISGVDFSPDCRSALVNTKKGTFFLDTATGQISTIQEMTGIAESVSASFISNTQLNITSLKRTDDYEGYATSWIYDLADGSLTTCYENLFIFALTDDCLMEKHGRLHIHSHKGAICVIDCFTGKHSAADLPDFNWSEPVGEGCFLVHTFSDNYVYLVKADGTTIPVYAY